MKQINAGCGPDRVITTAGGRYVWVSSGGGNALLCYLAARLTTDPRHALIAKVPLGALPLGMVAVRDGSRLVVANSDRDNTGAASSLAVIDVAKMLNRRPGAVIGQTRAGKTPRQFALEPGGRTLLVTNTQSGQVEAVDLSRVP